MYTELWLLNLFLAAQSLLALSILAFCWLHVDLYMQKKELHSVLKGIGGGLLAFVFVLTIVSTTVVGIAILQTLALATIVAGHYLEPIPGLPKLKSRKVGKAKSRSKKIKSLAPILIALIATFNSVFVIAIIYRLYKKTYTGLSKEYRLLLAFWSIMFVIVFVQNVHLFAVSNELTKLEVMTQEFSTIWILMQILKAVSAIIMFAWVTKFISFRIEVRMFIVTWQLTIYLSIILATAYSMFTISATEKQITNLLINNSSLVEYNLGQLKENNEDLVTIFKNDSEFAEAVAEKNTSKISSIGNEFIAGNSYLDKITVVDSAGLVIFDSYKPSSQGKSISSNTIIKKAIIDKEAQQGYILTPGNATSDGISFQYAQPILSNDSQVIGVIVTNKNINDTYLDELKGATGQELIVYANNRRSASTLIESDNVSRISNAPLVKEGEEIEEGIQKLRIFSVPYYVNIFELESFQGESVGKFVVAAKHNNRNY